MSEIVFWLSGFALGAVILAGSVITVLAMFARLPLPEGRAPTAKEVERREALSNLGNHLARAFGIVTLLDWLEKRLTRTK